MKKSLFTLLTILFVLPAMADEGMWLLQLMREQNLEDQMRAKGLEISADDIYSPNAPSLKDAIGIFGGGCTGEIVSPNGLIFTNHHCGYSYIQQLSAVEHNYLKDGFWSQSYEEELPCNDINFTFVSKITDVTDVINGFVADGTLSLNDSFNGEKLQVIADEMLTNDNIEGKQYLTAEIQPYFEGNKYYLVYYKRYPDVRLVGTPPSSVGKFGGETDNWMWPRHTGDFSVFRVYADANGNPAPYSPENKPLSTPKHLNISLRGVEENDFTMIMGFPGSTSRFLTSGEVKSRMTSENEPRIRMRDAALKVLREEMAKSEEVNIQYASKMASVSNYWKNSIGMNKAIVENKVIEGKLESEAEFLEFAKKSGNKEYETVVDKINELTKNYNRIHHGTTLFVELIINSEFLRRNLAQEYADKIEDAEFMNRIYDWIHNRDYNHEVDRKVAKALFNALMHCTDGEDRSKLDDILKKYDYDTDKMIDDVYDNSIMSNRKNFEKFIKKPKAKKFENDPAKLLREALYAQYASYMECVANYEEHINPLHKTYVKGLLEMANGTPVSPDANFTLRLTYGTVQPYQPRDGVTYNHYTTLKGVMEKEDPENPEFIVPAELKALYEAKDYGRYADKNGDLPVAFLSTNDITGGNSGSPIMNARGELIGLAFDGNWESLSGDIHFDDNLQRCINVDVRYVLFVIEKLGNCKRLIDELTIVE